MSSKKLELLAFPENKLLMAWDFSGLRDCKTRAEQLKPFESLEMVVWGLAAPVVLATATLLNRKPKSELDGKEWNCFRDKNKRD